jgi:hypothetical protein
MEEEEIKLEKYISDILWKFQISSLVKTDRKSLPYQHIISHNGKYNKDYGFTNKGILLRNIMTILLEENIYKIRFFIDINELNYENPPLIPFYKNTHQISFKYYTHKS